MDPVTVDMDVFDHYCHVVSELLAKDEDGDHRIDHIASSSLLYDYAINGKMLYAKREKLKSLLRQSIFILTPEIDKMLEPVVKIHCWQRRFNSTQHRETSLYATREDISEDHPEKHRTYSASSSTGSSLEILSKEEINGQDEEFLFYMKKDRSTVEVVLKQLIDAQLAQLGSMRQRLEAMLDALMCPCRLMTSTEKEELAKGIVMLPKENLGRALEILGHKQGSEAISDDEIFQELDRADNITLWRLHYYVGALKAAEKLGSNLSSLWSLTGKSS